MNNNNSKQLAEQKFEGAPDKACVAIAITQRFTAPDKKTEDYYKDYDVWAKNNHTQLGFQMNLTCPTPGGGIAPNGEHRPSHHDNQWWSSAAAFRLHFPYVSSYKNTVLFMKALGHTFKWGPSGMPERGYIGYVFGDPAPKTPVSWSPLSLPAVFGMLPMHFMMPMPMKAEFRAGAAGYIKSSAPSVEVPIIILQEVTLDCDKQDAFFAEFQEVANETHAADGVYGFYCTKATPSIRLTDPLKAKAGHHMENLVNLYVFETYDAFKTTLPKIKTLTVKTNGAYTATGKYSKVAPQAQIWAKSEAQADDVKKAMGDCDYYTFPKAQKSGFVDFKNSDGGTGQP